VKQEINNIKTENKKLLNHVILKANKVSILNKMSIDSYTRINNLISSQLRADILEAKMLEFNNKVNKLNLLRQKYN
jgi:hypothetical protein